MSPLLTLKALGIALLVGLSGWIGYRLHGDPAPVIQERVVTQTVLQHDVSADHIVYRDRVVTVTKVVRPDGTTQETTRTEEKQKDKDRSTVHDTSTVKNDSEKTVVPSNVASSHYSLGVRYIKDSWRDPSDALNYRRYEVIGGIRAIGGWWIDAGVQPGRPGSPSISLGIRYEW